MIVVTRPVEYDDFPVCMSNMYAVIHRNKSIFNCFWSLQIVLKQNTSRFQKKKNAICKSKLVYNPDQFDFSQNIKSDKAKV